MLQPGKTKAMDSDGKTQSKGTIPVSGCFLTYEAAEDGVLSIDQKTLATKRFYVVDSDGKVVVDYQNTNEKDTAAKYETLTAQVQAGKTYYIYANGSNSKYFKDYICYKDSRYSSADSSTGTDRQGF